MILVIFAVIASGTTWVHASRRLDARSKTFSSTCIDCQCLVIGLPNCSTCLSMLSNKSAPTLKVPFSALNLLKVTSLNIHHHHQRIASVGRRVAHPWWPRPRACLLRSAGVWLVWFRIWSTHLPRGRPGRRLQEGWERRPSERLTWDCRALCAGVLSCSLAMWPKKAMRRCRMTSLMAGRPVSADISELRTNCLHEIL